MNQQEWIEYFELVNGRKPTPAELSQAQAAGEFILERPNVFGATGQANEPRNIKPAEPVISMTQQPQFAQTTATFQQVVPAKKGMSKKAKIILASVLGAVAVILLSVGGYSLWRYQSGKIADGTYEVVAYSYRDEDKDKMVNAFDEFDDVYSFVEVKNNRSRYYSYLEDNKSPYVSLLEYETYSGSLLGCTGTSACLSAESPTAGLLLRRGFRRGIGPGSSGYHRYVAGQRVVGRRA